MKHRTAEGCKRPPGPVPLKSGEKHCPYCDGFGANPVPPDYRHWVFPTQSNPTKCYECDGAGKGKAK